MRLSTPTRTATSVTREPAVLVFRSEIPNVNER